MNSVAVGVVGVGRMGMNHCRVLSTIRNSELVGVYDRDPVVGKRIAEQYEVSLFENIEALLDQVDAVSIATPTQSHFEIAVSALERGLHVFIEKPITETIAEGEALVKASEASGQIVQIGHIERFNPVFTELNHILDGMTVLAINYRRLSPFAGSNTDVDVIQDLMIHDLDLMLNQVHKYPTSFSANGLTAYDGALDHVTVDAYFANGPLVSLTASRLTEQKVRQIEVTALEGYIVADLLTKNISIHRSTLGEYLGFNHHNVKYRQEGIVERIHVPNMEPLLLQLQHFVQCIVEHTEPEVTGADGVAALKLAEEIRDEVHGRVVDVADLRQKRGGPVPVFA